MCGRIETHENGIGVVRMRSSPVSASVRALMLLMIRSVVKWLVGCMMCALGFGEMRLTRGRNVDRLAGRQRRNIRCLYHARC